LKWFSDEYYVVRPSSEGLNFYLLKYGRTKQADTSATGSFAFHYSITPQKDGTLKYAVHRSVEDTDLKKELGRMWHRMAGDTAVYGR
jgi:hypothetical protein